MQALAWLEATSLATWVRESGSIWGYPLILTLHTLGLATLVGGSTVIDLRLLGMGGELPVAPLAQVFRVVWVGFAINALSGVLLFMADATAKSGQVVFWIKLACIAAAVACMRVLQTRVFGEPRGLAWTIPRNAKRLAAVSLLLWAGAITAGRLMAYY